MGTGELNAGYSPLIDKHPIQRGVEILLVTLCYRNQDKLRLDGPLGLYADLYPPPPLPGGVWIFYYTLAQFEGCIGRISALSLGAMNQLQLYMKACTCKASL